MSERCNAGSRFQTRRLRPSTSAFCRIAPSDRLRCRPIALAPRFPARLRIARTSAGLQGFRFFFRGMLVSVGERRILGRLPRQIVCQGTGIVGDIGFGRRKERSSYWAWDNDMDTEDLVSRLYAELPLETVARHEVGHAVMAVQCGGSVRRIILGHTASGEPFGRASWSIPEDGHKRLLVLSGGVLALFLHDHPASATFEDFRNWISVPHGYVLAASGAGDWANILALTGEPKGYGMEDFIERAVQPYFFESVGLLAGATTRLDELTELVIARPPGIGRLSLGRFFAGRSRRRWADVLDRPGLLLAARTELRARARSEA